MKIKGILFVVALAFLSGCASTPKISDMRQLFSLEVKDFLADKTLQARADYGQSATYRDANLSGVFRASGSWGSETAKFKTEVSASGEFCTKFEYNSEYEWTDPKYVYCSKIYQDDQGNFYQAQTKNTRKPKRVGKPRLLEISNGDTQGLMN